MSPSPSPGPRAGEAVKPTILAFHGSGSNGTIHTVQMARLTRHLKPVFDIVSLEAPFPSPAGPGILPFFEGCGPFKRWLPPSEKVTIEGMKSGSASSIMPQPVTSLIQSIIHRISLSGSRVVGLLGFSQGTRVVAGLLKAKELRRRALASPSSTSISESTSELDLEASSWLDTFEFAVSVCGSYPPPLIPEILSLSISVAGKEKEEKEEGGEKDHKIETPTLHVQGLQDEWHWAGKLLIESVYEVAEGKSEVFEFQMGHHYPVLAEDTERIRDWVLGTWGRLEKEVERRR
ncbi:serine hydrolase FSH [Clohesyomyces aquaticus]|uniref:Serine hydrolase FSH n=1 Tax=Clohesyomyces aquaticus TaxID=1231657 RepID=A0A1Y1ZQK8_9PLEO|nr:serine hydrolase FSH [Clohesyomyces aquaticus]